MPGISTTTPLLSVTVLNYNYAHFLPTCLNSILEQTFKDFEVILINDKSTDNSLDVIEPYLADSRIRLVNHQQNKGFVASLIEGVELSSGKYLSVISADDWCVDRTAFAKQVAILEQQPQVVLAFSAYGLYATTDVLSFVSHAAPHSYIRPGRDVFQDFILRGYPQHSGTIARKSAYESLGGYDPNLRWSVDAQLWLGICHFGDVAYIDEVLYAYRRHPSSMSKDATVLRNAIFELFHLFDWSFSFFSETDRRKLNWLYKKARRRALTTFASDAIFSGNYSLGWQFYKVGLQINAWETVVQKATIAMVLRVILGEQGFQIINGLKKRVQS